MARRFNGVAALAVLAVLLAASSCADGRDFHVGGRAGWAPNPAEPFNTWAERNRFQVNDTLVRASDDMVVSCARAVFRYNKDADAVLVVTPNHYDACNTTGPALRLGGGDSRFVFNSSGPYFFISADAGRCKAGERLIVVVLAVRNNNGPSTSSPSLSPPPTPKSSPSSTPPPPKSSSSPPVATPAPLASPPPPPSSGKNDSSPAPAPVPASPAPAPAGTNGTSSPPTPSSAVALRGGVLACLLISGAAILELGTAMARPIAVGVALALLVVLLAASSGAGRDIQVGGDGAWAPNLSEPLNVWAERNHFQVNDTLVFRYDKNVESVLLVSQSHYDDCNTTEPFLRLDGGNSRFGLNNAGAYFFISRDTWWCRAGARIIVVVPGVSCNGSNTLSPSLSPPLKSYSSPTLPVPTPAQGTDGTSAMSSAVPLRGGVLTCQMIGGAAIILV
ncbi:hypothetical protein BAE44_0025806 [Dichanthelium oligosanthes]|uniref:Phytocyanin domain-containing protein n=1 Tax=Dichanthelium oligosanthes TaxID=888268 RepID=A0A1E5UK57_9POAL|nr:hypothetical protein BAE44_0025806 [Dichanthelium oligosanthes]